MNILIIYAHPEPKSLNGSLKDFSVEVLEKLGHRVEMSDLYAMRWKPQIDADDFLLDNYNEPLNVVRSSKEAYETDRLTEDVKAEQAKLLRADAVLFQFPLWWFSMPAILKGWIDRVYAYGFGYGVGEHSEKRWGDRYGEGTLKEKRALLIVTTGGWAEHYSERGINGLIDDILFPINHGVLFYPGFDVLPSFVAYRTMAIDAKRFADITAQLRIKLENLFLEKPIPYRRQNTGEYNIPALTLRDEIEVQGQGFCIHQS